MVQAGIGLEVPRRSTGGANASSTVDALEVDVPPAKIGAEETNTNFEGLA